MPAKVADASVLAAIAFGEPRASEAIALLDDAALHEPTLLAYELTSVAHKKALLWELLSSRSTPTCLPPARTSVE